MNKITVIFGGLFFIAIVTVVILIATGVIDLSSLFGSTTKTPGSSTTLGPSATTPGPTTPKPPPSKCLSTKPTREYFPQYCADIPGFCLGDNNSSGPKGILYTSQSMMQEDYCSQMCENSVDCIGYNFTEGPGCVVVIEKISHAKAIWGLTNKFSGRRFSMSFQLR